MRLGNQIFAGLICAICLCGITSPLYANVVSGDKAYHTFEKSGYQYVFSGDHEAFMPEVLYWNEWFKNEYQNSYRWEFDQEAALVLPSGQNQIANGFATVVPHLKTYFYPAGVLLRDEFAVSSWFKVLLIHESSHLYQLNVKRPFPEALQNVVGNALVIPTPIIVPIFIHPNVLLPSFLLEGNSTMNESRWGIGGRLYSGEIRALVYSQALHEDLSSERLLNDHLNFPFGAENYYQGGYFSQFLAEKYGVSQTNLFFKNQADHFINPFILNSTFLKTFGSGYNQLFREFRHELKAKAKGQRSLSQRPLETTWFFSPLNHSKDEVFFLVQKKGKSYPVLWQMPKHKQDESIQNIKKKKIDLAAGKVFQTDRGWASAISKLVKPDLIEYGLYLEKLLPHPDYRGWAVVDQRSNHLLSFEPTKSFIEGRLYKDRQFVGVADSSAILDDLGRAYYFIQKADTRTLIRDQEELFSYTGYYGKLMEVDENGSIFFIASTEKGSNLFVWEPQGGIREVFESDQVIEARRLNASEFLVVELDYRGYHYKIATTKAPEKPEAANATQPYNFLNPVEVSIDQRISAPDEDALKSGFNSSEMESYNSLLDLRYDFAEFYYTSDEDDQLMGGVFLNFSDPLAWNFINLGYVRETYKRDTAYITYMNRRHKLGYQLLYLYEEDAVTQNDRLLETLYTNSASLFLNYPLFISGRWSADWTGKTLWEKEDQYFGLPEDSFGFRNTLGLDWSITYPLAYQRFRGFNVSFSHETKTLREPFKKTDDIYTVSSAVDYDLGNETYLGANYQASFSRRPNISLDSSLLPTALTDEYYSRAVDREYRLTSLQIKELSLKKAINQSYYFSRWPLSLRRWAPFTKVRHYDLGNNRRLPSAYWEYEAGVEIEFLLAHKIPLRSNWSAFHADPNPLLSQRTNFGWNITVGTYKDF